MLPYPCSPSSQRHKIWHLGRGKGRPCCPPRPRPQRVSAGGRRGPAGVPRAPPSPLLGRQEPGGRGSLRSSVGSIVVARARRARRVPRSAAVGSPAEQPQGRAPCPAPSGRRASCAPREGGLLEHLPLPRGSNLSGLCVRVSATS